MPRILIVSVLFLAFFTACSPDNIIRDDTAEPFLAKYNLTGTFGMFDNGQGKFTIYNLDRFRDSAYTPASTFKIVNSLIGIETGRVQDDSAIISWDGIQREMKEWNQDLTMKQAFHYSSVPWYRELARRIGKDTMQQWLDTLGYGGADTAFQITSNLDTFWLDNSVKVTADEQLGLIKKLYFDQLPFQKRSHRIVKDMMLREDNSNYKLAYKTGWGISEKQHAIGWIVGWIEENRHPYFFVLQVESPDRNYDLTNVRLDILKDVLKSYGFFEGKK